FGKLPTTKYGRGGTDSNRSNGELIKAEMKRSGWIVICLSGRHRIGRADMEPNFLNWNKFRVYRFH
ncbi:6191_t:CDS:1, partial [Paraglomus brasilianum]